MKCFKAHTVAFAASPIEENVYTSSTFSTPDLLLFSFKAPAIDIFHSALHSFRSAIFFRAHLSAEMWILAPQLVAFLAQILTKISGFSSMEKP